MLYLQTPQDVAAGANIAGTLRVVKNSDNPRAVDVTLAFSVDGGPTVQQLYHLL